MKFLTKATNFEFTPAIKQYLELKFRSLEKFSNEIIQASVEVELVSHHHRHGDIYRAEVNLKIPGKTLRVEKTEDDLYKAIDKVRDHLQEELVREKEHRRTAVRKRRKIGKMLKSSLFEEEMKDGE